MNILDIPILSVLISSGGLGFISFLLFNKMGKVKVYDNQDKVFYNILLSLINFIILFSIILLLSLWINIQVSILLSLVITLLISTVYPFLVPLSAIEKLKNKINNSRNESGLAYQYAGPVRENIFNNKNDTVVYIFDFDKNLINCGYITNLNTHNNEPYELIIEPFDEDPPLKNFDDIVKWSQEPDVEPEILINLNEKTQIYFIEM
ncbi:putative uncharacterized protein [Staphylococcus equorum subsp. equorum Mu2]|uniref:hypothetical protein n=1 Tax=Staphylococcus equorum TaxID=246432 RepID=UPI000267DEDD|nr:hypothetical protein [Staphylococcus equorum]MDW3796484.1 hypothetical protein [Staphylococcus saprophyticus]CCI59467.1 putative uncharacterized protein [Staphylococcus equorum subsp. equorum Mu2]